jgi:hypothetical protein
LLTLQHSGRSSSWLKSWQSTNSSTCTYEGGSGAREGAAAA